MQRKFLTLILDHPVHSCGAYTYLLALPNDRCTGHVNKSCDTSSFALTLNTSYKDIRATKGNGPELGKVTHIHTYTYREIRKLVHLHVQLYPLYDTPEDSPDSAIIYRLEPDVFFIFKIFYQPTQSHHRVNLGFSRYSRKYNGKLLFCFVNKSEILESNIFERKNSVQVLGFFFAITYHSNSRCDLIVYKQSANIFVHKTQ